MLKAVLPLQYGVVIYVFLRDTMEEIGNAMGVTKLMQEIMRSKMCRHGLHYA